MTSSSSPDPARNTVVCQTTAVSATTDNRNSSALSSETAAQVVTTNAPVPASISLDPVRSTVARQTTAVAAIRTSPPTSATTESAPYEKIAIKKSDIPSTLTLTGSQTQSVREVMSLFRSRIHVHAPKGTSGEAIDNHSVR